MIPVIAPPPPSLAKKEGDAVAKSAFLGTLAAGSSLGLAYVITKTQTIPSYHSSLATCVATAVGLYAFHHLHSVFERGYKSTLDDLYGLTHRTFSIFQGITALSVSGLITFMAQQSLNWDVKTSLAAGTATAFCAIYLSSEPAP